LGRGTGRLTLAHPPRHPPNSRRVFCGRTLRPYCLLFSPGGGGKTITLRSFRGNRGRSQLGVWMVRCAAGVATETPGQIRSLFLRPRFPFLFRAWTPPGSTRAFRVWFGIQGAHGLDNALGNGVRANRSAGFISFCSPLTRGCPAIVSSSGVSSRSNASAGDGGDRRLNRRAFAILRPSPRVGACRSVSRCCRGSVQNHKGEVIRGHVTISVRTTGFKAVRRHCSFRWASSTGAFYVVAARAGPRAACCCSSVSGGGTIRACFGILQFLIRRFRNRSSCGSGTVRRLFHYSFVVYSGPRGPRFVSGSWLRGSGPHPCLRRASRCRRGPFGGSSGFV